ncbi:uncharacterized protein LOC129943204 [Eupeodes corollae]|uniref:uncharacterized protein LOC129943204 n=1 Tax=Eupeodes corollae TaxID=290404 RepID=UPI002492FA19|nr:uncharacterized protein LOC129943204 [Eupeodes corollae]
MKLFVLVFITVNWFVLSWCQPTTTKTSMQASMPATTQASMTSAAAAAAPATIDDAAKKCMAQENIDPQYSKDFESGKIKPESVSTSYKCFIHCVVEARGFMKNGQLLEENIVKAAENIKSVDEVRKIIGNCKIAKAQNPCEESFNKYMCIRSELK